MIEKMTRYSFIILGKDKEQFLKELANLGVMDVKRSSKPVDANSAVMLSGADSLKKRIELLEKEEYGSDEIYAGLADNVEKLRKNLSLMEHWGEIDIEKLKALESRGICLRYYCVPEKSFRKEWEENSCLEIIERSEGTVWFVEITSPLSEKTIPVKETEGPSISLDSCRQNLDKANNALASRKKELETEKKTIPSLKKEYLSTLHKLDLYLANHTAEDTAEGMLSVFTGFAPSRMDSELRKHFDDSDAFFIAEPATAIDKPPILLKNNWFTKQFEVLTGMYGYPVYDEFDPTPVLAPFFLLFFAMCMGDAGYGILLLILSAVLKRMQGGLAGLWRLVMLLGIGTTVIGVALGTFFGISLSDAGWVSDKVKRLIISGEIAGFNAQMVLALAIGIFHICLAMVFKAVTFTKRFGFRSTVSTWGWLILIVGGLTVVGLSLANVIPSTVTKIAVIVVGVISASGIFIFNQPGRNPLLNVGAGLWDTYGMVTGLAGDILSYIRLFALGLAGGMLGSAFNTLASMTLGDNPTWQWLPFIIILLIGHSLNFAMACLGAFVHPLRLNFLEFFKNSGYEGKGTEYNPMSNNN